MTQIDPALLAACRPRHPLRAGDLDDAATLEALVDSLCRGDEPDCAIYVRRRAISGALCARFAQNFRETIAQQGSCRGPDGYVIVDQIGATQFGQRTSAYLSQCAERQPAVDGLFAGLSSAERDAILQADWLEPALSERGIEFLPAAHDGRNAGLCVARSWKNQGPFLLLPHEDAAQLTTAVNDDFELVRAARVFACVACMAQGDRGDLLVWNLVPDAGLRAALGLTSTGYPYPLELLADIPFLRVPLQEGDIALLDASRVHAVEEVGAGTRITVGRFIGRVSTGRVVWWT